MFVLCREENRRTQRKTLAAGRESTTNSTRIWHRAGIEPWPYWWESSSLTTAPSLLAVFSFSKKVGLNTDTKLKAFGEIAFRFQNFLKRRRILIATSCDYCTTELNLFYLCFPPQRYIKKSSWTYFNFRHFCWIS